MRISDWSSDVCSSDLEIFDTSRGVSSKMEHVVRDIKSFPVRERGNTFDDFEVGAVFNHHWGRTIEQSDNIHFSLTTLQLNPLHFNREYARENGDRKSSRLNSGI